MKMEFDTHSLFFKALALIKIEGKLFVCGILSLPKKIAE
jgi:hypothetical protein